MRIRTVSSEEACSLKRRQLKNCGKLSAAGILVLAFILSGCGTSAGASNSAVSEAAVSASSADDLLSDIPADPDAPASDFADATRYRVTADVMDLADVNTYPQRVDVLSASAPYDMEISIDHVTYFNLDNVPYRQYDYDEAVAQYLVGSEEVQVDAKAIIEIADSFAAPSASIQTIVGKALSWTKTNITYDDNLADEIFSGTSSGRSADETIACRKGTCNEYTNVFIACMRCLGIPARYIAGFWMTDSNLPMYHAWAEFYLQGYGWIPVDPMAGTWGQNTEYVKLFIGLDFADIDVKLREINGTYEIID